MSGQGFNGTTISFNSSAIGSLKRIVDNESGAEIDITYAGDDKHYYLAGLPNISIEVEVFGYSDVGVGDEGALSASWNDGGSRTLAHVVCTKSDANGDVDSPISSTLTFRPARS